MSLFGGDGSVPPYQSPYETDSENLSTSSPSSSPLPEIRNDTDEQLAQITTYSPNSIIDEDDELETETDSESEDESEPSRPNRFTGKPQTWKGYTLADRQIATSLDQIQDADLAAHLYNAHALKQRVQRPLDQLAQLRNWQSKDSWLRKGEELLYTDAFGELQTELVPSMDWTAWPLPLGKASFWTKTKERTPYGNEAHGNIGSSSQQNPGEELREEVLAVFLRLAKDKWNAREANGEMHEENNHDLSDDSRSLAADSEPPKSDVDMEDSDGSKMTRVSQGECFSEAAPITGRKRGRKPQPQKTERPVFLADDMKARQILRPTINSMLTQLDEVAIAIRRSRLNHFGRGADSDRSESEFTSDAESVAHGEISESSSRRSIKRKSVSQLSSRSTAPPKKDSQQLNRAFPDSDSASDYGAEHERKHGTVSRQGKRSRSKSVEEGESSATDRDWSGRVGGVVDWSEILGVAALKGWNSQAIARTAQRCALLFGEGMSFVPSDQSMSLKTIPEPVHFTPSTIPNFDAPHIVGQPIQKRPLFDTGMLRCPHEDCWGNEKEFEKPYRVIEHCKRVHGYDPRTNDSDNEERTVGGVHVDGFLQPITAKMGWLGKGRAKSAGETTLADGKTKGKRRKKQRVEEPLKNKDELNELSS